MIKFHKLHNERRLFLKKYCNEDHVVFTGENNILISAPHGVTQTRNNKLKVREPGSLSVALALYNKQKTFFIAKTKHNNDDANYDTVSPYRTDVKNLIKNNNIKYFLDFHGLAKWREMDVNLGSNYGDNTKTDPAALERLVNMLKNGGLTVEVDNPFKGIGKTLTRYVQKIKLPQPIFSLQVEINCGITNEYQNNAKFVKLVNILNNWIETLK